MELLLPVLLVVAVVLVFELAAVLFGADSRSGLDDPERRRREDWT